MCVCKPRVKKVFKLLLNYFTMLHLQKVERREKIAFFVPYKQSHLDMYNFNNSLNRLLQLMPLNILIFLLLGNRHK